MPQFYADRGKGGGFKPRVTGSRCSNGGEETFPARDIRQGQGTLVTKPTGARPKEFVCPTCDLARDLVSKAFHLGKSSLSSAVSSTNLYILNLKGFFLIGI